LLAPNLFSHNLANQDAAALHEQLFCYAHDLQELMWQYATLEKRHQKVLLAMGLCEHYDDLLFATLRQSSALYLVTNPQGDITFTSPGLDRVWPRQARSSKNQSVWQLMPPGGQADLAALLLHLSRDTAKQPLRHFRIALPSENADSRLFEALILKSDSADLSQFYWFLTAAVDNVAGALNIQKCFPFFDESGVGLFVTNLTGHIEAINPAFSQMTDYSAQDALGCDSRLLGAGLQDAAFFKHFWHRLSSDGCWNGNLFNRRKSGQVFLVSLSVKSIRTVDGETSGYIAAFDDKSEPVASQDVVCAALHDEQTGLPNRMLLERRMRVAMTDASNRTTKLFVLMLELAHFHVVYDEFGQVIGNLVLQQVSQRLQSAVRRTDTLARIDEARFVALLNSVDNRADAEKVANAMQFAMSAPCRVGTHRLDVRLSIGAVCYPADGLDVGSLLSHAQTAMDDARHAGNAVGFYQPGASQP
jgi:diguanylate cyclase (GGDEF)-like protein/PAS domain S-box-containing protein